MSLTDAADAAREKADRSCDPGDRMVADALKDAERAEAQRPPQIFPDLGLAGARSPL